MPNSAWPFLQPDMQTILAASGDPVGELAKGDVAAIIIRNAFPQGDCVSLIRQLIDQDLMFDPGDPRIDDKALSIQELSKYSRPDLNPKQSIRRRIDIGASLGNLGADQHRFFAEAEKAHALFQSLFADRPNPIDVIYNNLQQLAAHKRVITAQEPDGRTYGPAIFRAHYGGFTYGPHFDSVRNREKRTGYVVHRYEHQLAGVLCLQNSTLHGRSAQTILHRQFWQPELDDVLKAHAFPEYAQERNIPNARVDLEPGDLYFFNTGLIHEVPGVAGELPRIVLATFIGYAEDLDDIMVWS